MSERGRLVGDALRELPVARSRDYPSLIDQKRALQLAKLDNEALENKIVLLERNLNLQKQASLQTSLEIHGLPVSENESLASVVCDIAKALDVEMDEKDISNTFRLGRGDVNSLFPPVIMVKLFRQNLKE